VAWPPLIVRPRRRDAVTPKVVLVGLPGAGKSTTGRRLAKIMAVPFADSDHLLEAREGHTIAELFAMHGEPECRRMEAEVIAAALADFTGVLSLGGGAVTRAETRQAIADSGAPVVYLRAGLEELGLRVGDARTRPLLVEDPPARLAVLAAERGATYDELASITVDTDGRTPGQVAATIAARLHERRALR
jgi:shikimate kinase